MIFLNRKHNFFCFLYGLIRIALGIFLLYFGMKFVTPMFPTIPISIFLMLIPFFFCLFCAFLMPIVEGISIIIQTILNHNSPIFFSIEGKLYQISKCPKYLNRIYQISFIFYWFMMCFIGLYNTIKEGHYGFLLFLLPFFIAGIAMVKMIFKKKKH